MENRSKDLLNLELNSFSSSRIESTLLVCDKQKSSFSRSNDSVSDKKPTISSLPRSQVLGKARDFLGIMEEANRRLQLDAKDNSKAYDIEELNGNESEVIEMDLMLGVADLNTPEAVAAAESAIAGYQPVITLDSNSSGSDSEDNSDDKDDEEDKLKSSPKKVGESKAGKGDSLGESTGNNRSKKRPKIVVLS